MKTGAIILIGGMIFAAGIAGGAIGAFKISAERIERLTAEKTEATGERDTAIEVSEATLEAAQKLLDRHEEIVAVLMKLQAAADARAAREGEVAAIIADAPAAERGPVPGVVKRTIGALYANEAAP